MRSRPFTSITVKAALARLSISTRGIDREELGAAGQGRRGNGDVPGFLAGGIDDDMLDGGGEPGELVGPLEGAAGILDGEAVQGLAVGEGEDAGIDDIGPGEREGAGEIGEEAEPVGGIDRDLGRAARRIDPGLDGERRALLLGPAHQPRLAGQRRGVIGQPIGRGAAGEMALDLRLVPIGELVAERGHGRGGRGSPPPAEESPPESSSAVRQ